VYLLLLFVAVALDGCLVPNALGTEFAVLVTGPTEDIVDGAEEDLGLFHGVIIQRF
jgi:hypothetical protein